MATRLPAQPVNSLNAMVPRPIGAARHRHRVVTSSALAAAHPLTLRLRPRAPFGRGTARGRSAPTGIVNLGQKCSKRMPTHSMFPARCKHVASLDR